MTYHLIGLGGIGMSALARILLQRGEKVRGSDLKTSALLDELQREGAMVEIGHRAEGVHEAKTVVYSSDIQEDNVELIQARKNHLPILHRSDLLHELMKGKKNLLVTGTHGKTTTTALLASVLLEADLDPSFVIGGILRSFQTNGRAGQGEFFVAEADESDGSFLKTPADFAIVTNLEDDHLDHWGSSRMLDLAFKQFIGQAKELFWCADDPRLQDLGPKGTSYGFSEKAHLRLSHFRQTEEGVWFDLNEHRDIFLKLLGRHNALNAAAVFGLALSLKIPESTIREAFRKFAGTARRLEWKGEKHRVAVYDDYGHHPQEIRVTIQALRDFVREKRLIVVFQPHRYTRVRDLFEEFLDAFHEADQVFMTDIYAAGEVPIEGVTSAALYTRMREKLGAKLHFLPRTHLEVGVAQVLKPFDVVLTIGAGDITRAGEPILELYAQKAPKYTVGLLSGGTSAEHPVSLLSAQNIMQGIDPTLYEVKQFSVTREGKWVLGTDLEKSSEGPKLSTAVLEELLRCDLCIPVFHGPRGEDGMIAALLETLGLPYVGCDYRSGAVCMQKSWTKCVASHYRVQTAPFLQFECAQYKKDPEGLIQGIEEKIPYPVWVKPVHLGSSIGVSFASDREELLEAIELAFQYDPVILAEQHIEGKQIEFSVMGNDYIQLAPPGEIVNHGAFVAYDKKYGAGAMEIRVPAEISESEKKVGLTLAETMYRACGCKGLARVDFFLDGQGNYWFNEINPFPGFTDTSAFPKMWGSLGVSIQKLVDEMVILALHRSRSLCERGGKL